jgi:hypothetical protein
LRVVTFAVAVERPVEDSDKSGESKSWSNVESMVRIRRPKGMPQGELCKTRIY